MPHVMKLKDGKIATVFDWKDALELTEEYAGWELREFLEECISDTEELQEALEALEKEQEEELERHGDHQRALLSDIKEEAEALSALLDAERLDRKKLRSVADNIWRICYREL